MAKASIPREVSAIGVRLWASTHAAHILLSKNEIGGKIRPSLANYRKYSRPGKRLLYFRRAKNFSMRLLQDESGSVVVTFALIIVVLAGFAGMAIDLTRARNKQTAMQSALDAAVLAAVRHDRAGPAQVAFDRFMAMKGFAGTLTYVQDARGVSVSAVASADVPTTLMKLFGSQKLTITGRAAAHAPIQPTQLHLEIGQTRGYNNKLLEFWAQRPSGAKEVIATVKYTVTDLNGNDGLGSGTVAVSPSTTIKVDNYTNLWMVIHTTDYATLMTKAYSSSVSEGLARFFLNAKPLELSTPSLETLFPCGKTVTYSVEDTFRPAGSLEWGSQDFFFDLTTTCGPSPSSVWLTK